MKYTVINHAARKKFGINTLEYCLADSIYHLSNGPNGNGWAEATQKYYAEFLECHKRHIGRMIKKLEKKGLIINGSGSRLKTTERWYREAVIDRMKKMDKMSTMDNMSPRIGLNSLSEGEDVDNMSIKDNKSTIEKSGQNDHQKRTKCPPKEDNMSPPSNKDVYKGFYKYERDICARESDSLKTRVTKLAIQVIEEHKPEQIEGHQVKEAGWLIKKITEWISHLQEHKKLSNAQVNSNVETILLHDNPEKFIKYNLNGGFKNLYEQDQQDEPEGKLYSISEANSLFASNSLGGTNGSGYDFNDIFEHVKGEGKDMKYRLLPGKQQLISNKNY